MNIDQAQSAWNWLPACSAAPIFTPPHQTPRLGREERERTDCAPFGGAQGPGVGLWLAAEFGNEGSLRRLTWSLELLERWCFVISSRLRMGTEGAFMQGRGP